MLLACSLRPSAAAALSSRSPQRPRQRPQAARAQAAATGTALCPAETLAPATSSTDAVTQYNQDMARKMGWDRQMEKPFEYHFEGPLYYHLIQPDVIVGSQPRNALDVDHLAAQGVGTILNLQQDKDLAYWKVSIDEISSRAAHHGMRLVRTPAVDFSPHSLRDTLPRAVRALEEARAAGSKVYVHCTAGLGRSPAVAIAALYWFTGMQLDEAYAYLTGIRPCGPSRDAIRGATYDLLSNRPKEHFQHEPPHAFATLSDQDRQVLRQRLGLPASS